MPLPAQMMKPSMNPAQSSHQQRCLAREALSLMDYFCQPRKTLWVLFRKVSQMWRKIFLWHILFKNPVKNKKNLTVWGLAWNLLKKWLLVLKLLKILAPNISLQRSPREKKWTLQKSWILNQMCLLLMVPEKSSANPLWNYLVLNGWSAIMMMETPSHTFSLDLTGTLMWWM